MADFREALRQAMTDAKMTAPELSRLTGIPLRTIENWRSMKDANHRTPAPYLQKQVLETIEKKSRS